MNVLKCLAVDDEPHALELLEAYINRVPFLDLIKTTSSPWEALKVLEGGGIDLLFLDIQMDELTGIQMMDVGKINCPVILTTAYSEYALDGFNYEVSDYLLKPYSFDRFLKAVSKVRKSLDGPTQEVATAMAVPANNTAEHVFIKGDAKNKYHQVKLSDILFVEGLKNYVQFCCKTSKIVTLQNMKDIEQYLPSTQFMRIHRSYIVNLDAIQKIDGHTIYIENKMIGIGPSYRSMFYEAIQHRGF